MAILKCKICGGDLQIIEGQKICVCEHCGVKQTIPGLFDADIISLFNRANDLRINGEFDKAEAIYEKIIEKDNTIAEAYWGIILCKYGIEYVDDPRTNKKVPTCHRTSYDAILVDSNYKKAIEYSDSSQRNIYENEAKTIDEIQKRVLYVVKNEEPFDIFICYKETDDNGKRTIDSVITNEIYYQLTQEGYRVFYAPITFEDKLGEEYEPYIFSALNSAKIMLVVGTKPEYFNSVWVKNEWSRFLKLMKNNRDKLLVPCYKDMDAYDLPEEFAHLQAQDMSKLGFINDLLRGIKKIIKKDDIKVEIKQTIEDKPRTSVLQTKKKSIIGIALALIAVVCLIVVYAVNVIEPKNKLKKATELLNNGDYEAAYTIFEELGDYDTIISSKYDRAVALIDSKNYDTAYTILDGLNYKDSESLLEQCKKRIPSKSQVGSYLLFGTYEQDNNNSNGKEDIEWLVLAKEDNKIFLISKYALDCKPFNTYEVFTTWETSSLRSWLNSTFINTAFSSEEQSIIVSSYVFADSNPYCDTFQGNDTIDKVFLLSVYEVEKYFTSNNSRKCAATDYVVGQGAFINSDYKVDNRATCHWWLRSMGENSNCATGVASFGEIYKKGNYVNRDTGSVRPVLWLNIN